MIDDEEYEKKEIFYVVLGEPKVIKDEDDDSGTDVDAAEKERLEELGKPRLGTFTPNAFQYTVKPPLTYTSCKADTSRKRTLGHVPNGRLKMQCCM